MLGGVQVRPCWESPSIAELSQDGSSPSQVKLRTGQVGLDPRRTGLGPR